MDIEVTRDVIAALIAQAQQTAGLECCGLLLGPPPGHSSALARITHALPVRNVHPQPARHFEIDPVALIGAYRAERNAGPALLGFYHSHPNGHPRPSASDCDHAGGDGRVWAIIAAGAVYFWCDTPQGFLAVAAAIVPA